MSAKDAAQLAIRLDPEDAERLRSYIEEIRTEQQTGQASANRAMISAIGYLLTEKALSAAFTQEARKQQISSDELLESAVSDWLEKIRGDRSEKRAVVQHPDHAEMSFLSSYGYNNPLPAFLRFMCERLNVKPRICSEPPPQGRHVGSRRASFAEILPFRRAISGSISLADFKKRLLQAGIAFVDKTPRERHGKPTSEDWTFIFKDCEGVEKDVEFSAAGLGLYHNGFRKFDRSPAVLLGLWESGKPFCYEDKDLVHHKQRHLVARKSRSKSIRNV